MGQHQIKVSFSLGTKLLLSVLALILIAIGFLDVSTIYLMTEDKRAYTYQAQSMEANLVGREFSYSAKHAMDTLRLSMASVDPRQGVTEQHEAALQSIVDNQSETLGVVIGVLQPMDRTMGVVAGAFKQQELVASSLTESDLVAPESLNSGEMASLFRNNYTFLNLSKVGRIPVLGVMITDAQSTDRSQGIPFALGFVSLAGFGKQIKASSLTVATREGWVIFDTDPAKVYLKRNIKDDALFQASMDTQVSSGAKEYESDGNLYLGSYIRPGLDVVVLTQTEWRKAMRATFALTEKLILLGFMAVGAAILFAILFSKRLTAPLNMLYEATKEVAAGNFNVAIPVKGRDEIGALSGSFVTMSRKINELIQESMRKVYLENELAIASTVQQTLIPPSRFENADIEISSFYQSAAECGGDWWGFFGVNRKLCLMIADATGHGLPSALITASARSCASMLHKLAQEDPAFSFSPAAMLDFANRVIYDAASGRIMMTFFAAVIDFDAMTLTYSSAGHNPPWLFRQTEAGLQTKSLMAVGSRLGEVRDIPLYEEKTIEIANQDIIFLYTDGLLEGMNSSGEMFGKKRTRRSIEANLPKGPERILESLISEYSSHNQGKALDDDITIATVRILAPNRSGVSSHLAQLSEEKTMA